MLRAGEGTIKRLRFQGVLGKSCTLLLPTLCREFLGPIQGVRGAIGENQLEKIDRFPRENRFDLNLATQNWRESW